MSRLRVRWIACLDSSNIVGIGVLFLVVRSCIRGCRRSTLGDVASNDVDGCVFFNVGVLLSFTLGTELSVFILGGALFSLLSLTRAASLKIVASCLSACVCFGFRSIGAFDIFSMATMRS